MSSTVVVIAIVVAVVLVGVFIIISGSKPQKERKANGEKMYKKLYNNLSSNFLFYAHYL